MRKPFLNRFDKLRLNESPMRSRHAKQIYPQKHCRYTISQYKKKIQQKIRQKLQNRIRQNDRYVKAIDAIAQIDL